MDQMDWSEVRAWVTAGIALAGFVLAILNWLRGRERENLQLTAGSPLVDQGRLTYPLTIFNAGNVTSSIQRILLGNAGIATCDVITYEPVRDGIVTLAPGATAVVMCTTDVTQALVDLLGLPALKLGSQRGNHFRCQAEPFGRQPMLAWAASDLVQHRLAQLGMDAESLDMLVLLLGSYLEMALSMPNPKGRLQVRDESQERWLEAASQAVPEVLLWDQGALWYKPTSRDVERYQRILSRHRAAFARSDGIRSLVPREFVH